MKSLFNLVSLLLLVTLFSYSCKSDKVIPTDCTDIHWTYTGDEGADHWSELCTGYSDCGGTQQSPINIVNATADASLSEIVKNHGSSETHILNNGHTMVYTYDAGSSITVNGTTYNLLQFHTHTPSEHTINGVSYPMEIHFVHKDPVSGNLAVIGVVVEEGAANAALEAISGNLPATHDAVYESATTYTAADLIPSGTGYFTYPGSLTTPPCSQIVTWLVLKEHITASHEQILKFEELEHENNRPVQNLNGRTIKSFN